MSEASIVRVLGVSGSLRKDSHNSAALRAAGELMPEGMVLETVGIADLPHYHDHDDLRQQAYPPVVQRFRERIAGADAILFATPEYNFSVPGVLKNAIDWASRPPDQPFNLKPGAVIGASTGLLGTARAQYHLHHLRQICGSVNMLLVNKPEVFITFAAGKFDAEARLTDQGARDLIAQLMLALRDWVLRLRR